MKSILRVAASTVVMSAGLRLAGLGVAAVARWCPGQWWDPVWGRNWDFGRCHDDHWFDGDPRDQGHWHGY